MKNPYEQLYIYYFEGIPQVDRSIETMTSYLGNWVDDEISFLFFSKPSDTEIRHIETCSHNARLADQYEMTGEQWHGDRIEPYYINDLCVFPPWQRPDPVSPDEIQVMLDPGVVFGTGRHQTTEDCLFLIYRLLTQNNINTVLDIGTGTGLLSLGAAALGSKKVLACDFNFLAVKTTLNNIRLNGFGDRIVAFQARGEQVVSLPCDLMVANIHYDVMRHIIEHPHFLRKPWIILSGLLNSEAKKVMDRLSEKKVHVIERRCPDGVWNTLLCKPGSCS